MIELHNISKYYPGGVAAVRNISLVVEKGKTLVLIGLSGCGKTTTLKMINRLIEPDSGEIRINGMDNRNIDPIKLRRNIGYVIQDIGLFPHMTVEENIAIVPKLKKWPVEKIDRELKKVLNTARLPDSFLGRYPHHLSGGQQQRVGVARALIANPDIILMDEPFGALDPITREELQEEFSELKKEIKKTIVFVTHDVHEAFKVGDRIAVMKGGNVIQAGVPMDLIRDPHDDFVRRFISRHSESLLVEFKQGGLGKEVN